jgi:uncharacterized protein
MMLRREPAVDRDRETPLWGAVSVGAVVRLVSSLTGVGGAAFLATTLVAPHWRQPSKWQRYRLNYTAGLTGILFAAQFRSSYFALYAVAALGGAIVGSADGVMWLSQQVTTR